MPTAKGQAAEVRRLAQKIHAIGWDQEGVAVEAKDLETQKQWYNIHKAAQEISEIATRLNSKRRERKTFE